MNIGINSEYISNMKTALDAYNMRDKAISENLANSDTPNYKRKYVKFEEYLARASNPNTLKGAVTNNRHMDIPDLKGKMPSMAVDRSVSTREDGNNVNVDVEGIDNVKNYINYNAVADQMSSQFRSLITAITGGRK